MDKTTLVASWFGATFTALIFSVFFLVYLSTPVVVNLQVQNLGAYSALPDSTITISDGINFTDARAKIVEDFFKGYNSPLASQADVFVKVADKNKLDFRLLPAIAMQESNGAKRMIKNSHNPFGFGIYGDKVLKFDSFEEGIERVGNSLKKDYVDQGLKTPQEIMTKYTPLSLAKGGAWAKGVTSFMFELQ